MVVIGDLESIEAAALNLRRKPSAASRTSNVARAVAARTLHTSNTGLPGAFKAPPPPPEKTLNKRKLPPTLNKHKAPAPITSQQMAPTPAPTPAPAEVVSMPGSGGSFGGGGGGGGGDAPVDVAADEPLTTRMTAATGLTTTQIGIGIAALVAAVIVAKKVL